MSKRKKMSMIIFMIMIVGIFILSTKVEAALQSNGGTPLTANLNDWISAVRQMQATGGTLGLTDTINTNLISSNKNMDIHMQKNTEYGAMAILSASAYGKPNKITDGQTTTGNASGIQIKLNEEWVAAGPSNTMVGNMKNAAKRYWNNYGTGNGSNSKNADAMAETNGWHGSSGNSWLRHWCSGDWTTADRRTGDEAFVRAYGGSIFGFYGSSYVNDITRYTANWDWCAVHGNAQNGYNHYINSCLKNGYIERKHYGRACVVVGSGV